MNTNTTDTSHAHSAPRSLTVWLRCLISCLLVLVPGLAHAQTVTSAVPGQISYQGKVLNASGALVGASPNPVNRTVIFRIWATASSTLVADLLYSETQTVTISDGEFSVLVGNGVANSTQTFGYSETAKGPPTVSLPSVFNGPARYLGVTVAAGTTIAATDNEITPRQQIVSTGFAMRAKFAEQLGSNGNSTIVAADNGNVGVGNATPPALFTITGANTSTTTNTPQLVITDSVDQNKRLIFGVDSTGNGTGFIQATKGGSAQNLLLNPNGGNVGIGNASPTARLDVTGGIKATGAGGYTFNTGDLDGGLFSPADGVITLLTNNTERVRVDGSGNVGIGVTAPLAKLDVNGAVQAPNIELRAPSSTPAIDFSSTAGVDFHARIIWEGTAANRLSFDSPSFYFTSSTGGSGNVGIGTGSPSTKLEVAGSSLIGSSDNSALVVDGTGFARMGIVKKSGLNPLIACSSGSAIVFAQSNQASLFSNIGTSILTEYMRIDNGGNVGIGTTSPTQGKLVVMGSAGSVSMTMAYFNRGTGTGIVQETSPNNRASSIYAQFNVSANEFYAFSDSRIKNVIGPSNGEQDLTSLMGIQITDYTFKDTVGRGAEQHKKVIAQQVEKVYPLAVSKGTDVVPDIYQKAALKDGWVELKSDLKKGERVRLISRKGDVSLYEVAEVKKDKFRLLTAPEDSEVFVYGREVKDFRAVDYEAISMLNVSATQQIKKEKDAEVKALQSENTSLKDQLAAQSKQLAELQAKDKARDTADKARDAKLVAIEKALESNAAKPAVRTAALHKAE